MPKVTGVQLMQKLQDARIPLPVIMATGKPPDEESTRQVQPAIMLLKPYTFDELVTAVKAVLRAASDSLENLGPPPNWQPQPGADRLRL